MLALKFSLLACTDSSSTQLSDSRTDDSDLSDSASLRQSVRLSLGERHELLMTGYSGVIWEWDRRITAIFTVACLVTFALGVRGELFIKR